jgi:hypothetical protein
MRRAMSPFYNGATRHGITSFMKKINCAAYSHNYLLLVLLLFGVPLLLQKVP